MHAVALRKDNELLGLIQSDCAVVYGVEPCKLAIAPLQHLHVTTVGSL